MRQAAFKAKLKLEIDFTILECNDQAQFIDFLNTCLKELVWNSSGSGVDEHDDNLVVGELIITPLERRTFLNIVKEGNTLQVEE